ncbi:MAG: hypothetical protein ACYSTJ_09870 [Planctomycetota bacterium]|jgi:hypothetical protein
MKLLILSNNPARASFRQRIGVHLETLSAGGIDCEVVKLPGSVQRFLKLLQISTLSCSTKNVLMFLTLHSCAAMPESSSTISTMR